MTRIHLFELEDLDWFPRTLRDYMTEWLAYVNNRTQGWDLFAPVIASLLRASKSDQIVDLCSGAGGPAPRLRHVIARTEGIDSILLLTDKYPNHGAFALAADADGMVSYRADSIDAAKVPHEIGGVRTMFCSFHHFDPEMARRILANASDGGRAIGVFEVTARSVTSLALTLGAPLNVLLTTPFIRPFRWGRLVFTYLIPILPLCCLWDGIVSCLRSYSADELRALVQNLAMDGYEWDVGEIRFPGTPVMVAYLTGRPTAPLPEAPPGH